MAPGISSAMCTKKMAANLSGFRQHQVKMTIPRKRERRGHRTDMLRSSKYDRDMKGVKRCGTGGQWRSTWREVNFMNHSSLQVCLFSNVDASTRQWRVSPMIASGDLFSRPFPSRDSRTNIVLYWL